MNTVFWRMVLAVLALAWISTPASSAETDSREAAEQLATLLKGYESYQAQFIQVVVNETGSRVQETRGQLKAKRPGLFYWETREPMAQFIVSDGHQVEVYDPDLEQVTIHTLDDQVQATPALLLSGEVDNLDETYRVSERRLGNDTREFTLEPRSPDSLFVSLRLTFFQGELQEMRMKDSLSQLSILSFDHIRLNAPLENTEFSLEYPKDVDIIRDGA
ncbi:outer membrane lipoprotein carrier protein LolA [Marinobacter lutaoensis]|uniref:Outer-membrane lipoprotein carrier protein n=1 Tax=Marinobacter lutaoensis TaxID=135739 RepID=A0A1V2DU77_9GAMM|nr:outer membrane lipoprotein chaperone LolA [Marinobacter lutaoensis]ONF44202.1 outer membrane lipoprotein carrier protein LolA [Marinobacter lutaoensis]